MNTSFEPKSQAPTQHNSKHENQNSKAYPSRTIVHAKLEMTEPGDHDEREADAMARAVVSGGKIARKISSGGSGSSGIAVSSQMESQLNHLQGGGQAMPKGLRSMMESGFGQDFGQVRLHTDSEAARMSSSIHAKAFTHGNDIYFNRGQFSPETYEGQRLVAHELTHVVQGGEKVARTTTYSSLNPELINKIIDICDKVLDKINPLISESENKKTSSTNDVTNSVTEYGTFKGPSLDKLGKKSISPRTVPQTEYEKLFCKYVFHDLNLFIDFNKSIQKLLSKLKNKVNQLKLGIKDGYKNNDEKHPDHKAACETYQAKERIKRITCYSGLWTNDLIIEEKALYIIHEFSHMWLNTEDTCYWYNETSHRDQNADLFNDPTYCGNSKFEMIDKTKVASAIEYYIRGIYRSATKEQQSQGQ